MSFMSPFLLTPCPLSLPPSPPQNAHACLSAWMQGSGLSEGTAYTFAFRVTNPTNAQSSPPVPALSLLCVSGVCVFLMGAHVCVYTPHTHTHTHARAHTHTHTRVRLLPLSVYTCMRTCIQRMSVHTCMCTCIHRRYMHAYNAGEHSGNCVCWRCSHHLYLPQPYGTLFSFSLCRPPHPPPTPLLSIISPSPLTFSHTHTYSDTLSVTSPLSLVCPRLHYRLLTLCPAAY